MMFLLAAPIPLLTGAGWGQFCFRSPFDESPERDIDAERGVHICGFDQLTFNMLAAERNADI
jgi:hypothetical protein